MTGILGRKLGMTQVFDEDGKLTPVTLIEAGPCSVVQVKTKERDKYSALKIGFDETKNVKKLNKPTKGVFEKAGTGYYRHLKEFRMEGYAVNELITVEKFAPGDIINVSGVSKGKGFQGVMKRHNYSGGPGSHGSMFNRAPGSIGCSAYPSRVWKNKGMPGQMGAKRTTIRNLTVVDVKNEQNLLIVKGAVPGAKGIMLEIVKKD